LRIEKVSERIQSRPPILARPIDQRRAIAPVVVIGSSTGGPPALVQIFGAFTEPPPCTFLVAQHMPSGFTRGFAERLDRLTPLRVHEAEDGEELEPGTALIAPGGSHLELEMRGSRVVTRLDPEPDSARYVPSVDRLFESAAKQFGERLLAIVLTGMGDDGRKGACQVKEAGGRVIAESEETAVIYGMPKQVVNAGAADKILPLQEIPAEIQIGIGPSRFQQSMDRGRS
jgi:two-component system chemotaxis response regulator CheB